MSPTVVGSLPAAAMGHLEVARFLIEKGADVNRKDPDGYNALFQSAANDNLEVLKALLRAQATPDVVALGKAVAEDKAEMVRALLDAGLDPNARREGSGHTGLTVAAKTGKSELARLLLERGARAEVATDDGWTPLMLAAKEGHSDIARMLIEKRAPIDAQERGGSTALMGAAGGGHADIVALLLHAGAKTDLVERQMGADALLAASIGGGADTLRLLLDAGCAVDFESEDGFTALMYCASRGDADSLELLISRGANVNHANRRGETALQRAAGEGQTDAVKTLTAHGASIDQQQKDGLTALMVAADKGHLEAVQALLAAGADRELRGLALRTACDYARIGGHEAVEELLSRLARPIPRVKRPTKTSEAATLALYRAAHADDGFDDAVRAIEEGAMVDGIGEDIPIVIAAHCGATDIVRLLIEHGADVEAGGEVTALVKACGGCHGKMAKALIDAGAKVTDLVRHAAQIHANPRILALIGA